MTVYLVGAGPGDPGLLTRRGAALLARADVVVYDRLLDPAILALAPRRALLIDAGKRPASAGPRPGTEIGDGQARQGDINAALVEHGRRSDTVVRLKGGDPFLFGRGGEEAAALSAAGVPWEIVPGVTSAIAVPAVAGVPVTHRGVSTSVTVVTGHVGDDTAPGGVDWNAVARTGGTLVILMGMATRAAIADRLLRAGLPPETPVCVIEWGTMQGQRVERSMLARLASVELGSPAVIVVGGVAGLDLGSGEGSAPLAGWSVVVTRAAEQRARLHDALVSAGARVIELPMIEIADPADGGAALHRAASEADRYDWVVFTSANSVRQFVAQLRDGRALGTTRLAVVGDATADALMSLRLVPDLVAARASAAGLVESFASAPAAGGRVLFPCSAQAGPTLPAGLRAKGWDVEEVIAYRTVETAPPPGVVADAAGGADAVIFSSPSTVAAYLAAHDTEGRRLAVPRTVVCIGPVTAAAARAAGLTVAVEAEVPSPAGLVAALMAHRAGHPGVPVGGTGS
jgi:uroporphyrinogen III methyltransferase / synthase